jgi:hypothetical protein
LGEAHPGQRGDGVGHSYALPGPFGPADSAPTVNIQPVIGVIALETAIFIKRPHLVLMVQRLITVMQRLNLEGIGVIISPGFSKVLLQGRGQRVTRKWFLTLSVYLDSY